MKKWYKSKTQLVAIAGLLIVLLSTYQEWLSSDAEVTLLISMLAMSILRWMTDGPVTSVVPQLDSLRPKIKYRNIDGIYNQLRSKDVGTTNSKLE
jgi:hypothetical protein